MATEVFQLTSSDLATKVSPVNGEFTFEIGAGKDMTEAHAEEVLRIAEDQVLMRLPRKYARLVREVDGEVLIHCAKGGETSFSLGLPPATSLSLWKNYPFRKGWGTRSLDEALTSGTDYSADLTAGTITMAEELVAGDTLLASYAHAAGAKLVGLRDCALSIAAVETARRFAYFRTADGFDRFEAWERTAYANLNQLRGVEVLDRMTLLEETDEDGSPWGKVLLL